ncbi:MAG: hypothetical protein IH840_07780 [Candidatus Heimdallarchaeota archaeon]|nr:hypothetical protein [Candidatus Heimdallarchaeota archaeon]
MRNRISLSQVWLRGTIIGFLAGLVASIIVFIVLKSLIDLTLNHVISSIVHVATIAFFQFRVIKSEFQNTSMVIGASLISAFVSVIMLGLVNLVVDLELDILVHGISSSSSTISWGVSSLILGSIYGVITGYYLSYLLILSGD